MVVDCQLDKDLDKMALDNQLLWQLSMCTTNTTFTLETIPWNHSRTVLTLFILHSVIFLNSTSWSWSYMCTQLLLGYSLPPLFLMQFSLLLLLPHTFCWLQTTTNFTVFSSIQLTTCDHMCIKRCQASTHACMGIDLGTVCSDCYAKPFLTVPWEQWQLFHARTQNVTDGMHTFQLSLYNGSRMVKWFWGASVN